jgi:hypothetical protein
MSFTQLLRPAKRNLYQVLSLLPNKGVGARVTRAAWASFTDSYFEITQVKLRTEKHGTAWGIKVFKGVPMTDKPTDVAVEAHGGGGNQIPRHHAQAEGPGARQEGPR